MTGINRARNGSTPSNPPKLSFSGLKGVPEASLQSPHTPKLNFPASIQTESNYSFGAYTKMGAQPVLAQLHFPGGDDVESFTQAILDFDENQASPREAREIARAVLSASEEFNVDPRLLLATLAHESHFDPGADRGNGKGLGQVTRPARQELNRISDGGPDGHRARVSRDTYARLRSPSARALFNTVNSSNSKTRNSALLSITPNVRTSAAYLRVMLDIKRGDVSNALSDYNGSGGAIQRAYPGKVGDAYEDLWETPIPEEVT